MADFTLSTHTFTENELLFAWSHAPSVCNGVRCYRYVEQSQPYIVCIMPCYILTWCASVTVQECVWCWMGRVLLGCWSVYPSLICSLGINRNVENFICFTYQNNRYSLFAVSWPFGAIRIDPECWLFGYSKPLDATLLDHTFKQVRLELPSSVFTLNLVRVVYIRYKSFSLLASLWCSYFPHVLHIFYNWVNADTLRSYASSFIRKNPLTSRILLLQTTSFNTPNI